MDVCGNESDTLRHTLRINDTVAPAISGTIAEKTIDGCDTNGLSLLCPMAMTATALEALDVRIVETCSEVTVHCTETMTGECPIVVTRKYVVKDACGNVSDTITQVINIQDTTRPAFNITLSDSLLESNNCVFVVPDYVAIVGATVSDNCTATDELTVLQSPQAGVTVTNDTVVTITATDNCDNTDTITVMILLPTMPQLSTNLTDTAICQGNSVTLVATVTGGTPSFDYEWAVSPTSAIDDPNLSTITVSPEDVGTYVYSVSVTDANGCSDFVENIRIYVNETPDTATTVVDPNTVCTGTPNGKITITSPVDDGYYFYSLNGGRYQTEPYFENLPSDDYTLTVMTEDGCISDTVTVHVGASRDVPDVSLDVTSQVLCPTAGAQTATARIEGGTEPFVYEWHGAAPNTEEETTTIAIDESVCDSVYSFYVSIKDANQCVDTARATITVLDNVAPEIHSNLDTVWLYGCSSQTLPDALASAYDLADNNCNVSDNCVDDIGDLTLTLVSTQVTEGCPVRITRTYRLSDLCGNVSDSIRETIIITDNTEPAVQVSLVEDTINGCTAEYAPRVAGDVDDLETIGFRFSDECGSELTLSFVSADTSVTNCPIVITRNYRVVDPCGNPSDMMTHVITIFDSIRPVINGTIAERTIDGCDLAALQDYPIATDLASLVALGVEIVDSCSVDNVQCTETVEDGCPIVVTRKYVVKDECGNVSDTLTQIINIQDTTRPAFNITLSDSLLESNNCVFVVPDYVAIVMDSLSDNCTATDELRVLQSPAAGVTVTNDTVVTITATDNCDNTDTMTVRIMLPTMPQLSTNLTDTSFCQGGSAILTAFVENGTPDYTYLWYPSDSLSATDVASVTASPDAGDHTYRVVVSDANGCKDTVQVQVTVHEVPPTPSALTSENTLCEGGFNGSIVVLSPEGAGYQYSLDTIYQSSTVFDSLQQGFYDVYVKSADGCVSEPVTVKVGVSQDMPKVTITAPDTVLCPNAGVQTVTAVVTDATGDITYTWTGAEPTPGDGKYAVIAPVVNICDTLYIFSVEIEDENHCTNSVTDTIVVRDNENPTITGTLDTVTYNGCDVGVLPAAARTAAELIGLGLEIADNCTPTNSLVVAHIDDSEGSCPIVVHRYYTVTDGCGNISDRFEQIFHVFDSMAPVVTVAEKVTNLNGCDESVAPVAVSTASDLEALGFAFSDGCTDIADLQLLVSGDTVGSCPTVVTYKYIVKDACGNVSDTMTHIITIFDSIAPVVSGTIAEVTMDGCDTNGLSLSYPMATTVNALETLGAEINDNCTEITVHCTETMVEGCPIVVTRKYVVKDACGNASDTITQIINIQDTVKPYFTDVIGTQYLAGSGGNFYIPDFSTLVSPIVGDNCTPAGQIGITQSPEANTRVNQNQTVTVTISDACHNIDTMVVDVVVPEVLMVDIIQPDSRFCYGESVELTPMVYGGTPDYTFTWSPAAGLSADDVQNVTAAPDPGTHRYVVKVTDADGSIATDTITIIVDTIPAVPQLTRRNNSACAGVPNGAVTVTSPVGDGYTYSLNGGAYQDSPEFTELEGGIIYKVTVRTAAGCVSDTAEITIDNDINMPEVTLVAPDTILCPNIGTQEIIAEITGGTEPFNITWSGDGVQTSATATTVVNVDASQCNRMYIIEFNLTDSNHCAVAAKDTLYVRDDVVPTITGTLDIVTYNGCTAGNAPAAFTTPAGLTDTLGLTLADNCTPVDNLRVSSRDVVEEGECPIVIKRYYKVTDLCGNESEEFMQTLQVFDSVAPYVTTDEVTTHLNACDETAAEPAATTAQALQTIGFAFGDVCTDIDDLQVSHTELVDGSCPTTIIRKYVVKDACGNVSDTMTHIITIFDSIAPVINGTIAEVTIDGCDLTALQDYPIATDLTSLVALGVEIVESCIVDTVQYTETVTYGCPIVVTRKYVVKDGCGNVSDTLTQIINIQDTTAPVFAAQVEEHLLVSDSCRFVVPDLTEEVRAVSSDNCTTVSDSLVITQIPAAGTTVTADMTVAVTVKDSCGNSSVMHIQLRMPETITLSVEPSTTQYCEWDTVELSAVPAGGVGDYTYAWTPDTGLTSVTDSTVLVVTGKQWYEYSLTVTDGNGCTATATYTLPEPSHLTVAAEVQSSISCLGGSNGVALATAANGVETYSYVWSNGMRTAENSGLSEGTYSVVVTDAYGCTATDTVTFDQPTKLAATVLGDTAVLCFGDDNGSIELNIEEGTAPYSLTVNGISEATDLAAGNYTIRNRTAGTHIIVVTDANGCTVRDTSVIEGPGRLSLTEVASAPITCFGGDDGAVTVSVSGGTARYTVWMDDSLQIQTLANTTEQATFMGIDGGDHVFTVTDSNSCSATLTMNFREPDPMSTVVNSTSNVTCYGQRNGMATVTISGGTLPYVLTVADDIPEITLNTENPYTIRDLDTGIYTIGIIDDHGCPAQMEVTIRQPDSLKATASVLNNVDCFGMLTGEATVTPEGGTQPYAYSWTGNRDEQMIDGLAAGVYVVTVTDANGCTAVGSANISEPDELTLNLITLVEGCDGEETGIIEVEAHGGTPNYTYAWDNGQGTAHIENLAIGSYTVTVTDQHNCFDTLTVVVPFHPMPDFTVSVTPAYCERTDGTATVMGDNLGAYNYDWNCIPNPNGPVNDRLGAGDYNLVVGDGVCTMSIPFTIDAVPGPTADFSVDLTEVTEGNTVHFTDHSHGSIVTWEYDFGDGTLSNHPMALHEFLDAGDYWTVLTVTDEHNCVDTASVLINVIPEVLIHVPNAFTPNDDGLNDIWLPVISNNGDAFYELLIYSRWGELIFRSNDPNVGWNGKHNGKTAAAGVYTYVISYTDYFNKKYQKTGTVTVVR